jgi:hypothetical protein
MGQDMDPIESNTDYSVRTPEYWVNHQAPAINENDKLIREVASPTMSAGLRLFEC